LSFSVRVAIKNRAATPGPKDTRWHQQRLAARTLIPDCLFYEFTA
jgi:hypothetical protein